MIILIILILFVSLLMIGIISERRAYNHGKCRHCGNNLRLFDTDSQGGRGYMCDSCCNTIWVSYHSVDKS